MDSVNENEITSDEMEDLKFHIKSLIIKRDKLRSYKTSMGHGALGLEQEILIYIKKVDKDIKSLDKLHSQYQTSTLHTSKRKIERLVKMTYSLRIHDDYNDLFTKLLHSMESYRRYFANGHFHFKVRIDNRWQRKWLFVFAVDGRTFNEMKTDDHTVRQSRHVCVRVSDCVYIYLLVEEISWRNSHSCMIFNPKLHKQVDCRFGVSKDIFKKYLFDECLLVQVTK